MSGPGRAVTSRVARLNPKVLHAPYRMLTGENISARFVVPTVATSVDVVVHLGIGADGVRRVNEIVSVPGRVEADVIEVEPIFQRTGTELRRAGGVPARLERYERVGIDIDQVLADHAGVR